MSSSSARTGPLALSPEMIDILRVAPVFENRVERISQHFDTSVCRPLESYRDVT
jgi:hypothetical protein